MNIFNQINLCWLAMGNTPQGTESTAPGWVTFLPIILVFVIFYFILIRPQQRQQKEQQKLVESVKGGDQVLLSSGIYGVVTEVKDKTLLVKIADNVKVKVLRTAVAQVISGDKEKTGGAN